MRFAVVQKHHSPSSFLWSLLIINLLVILAIDMYIPALPNMQEEFAVDASYLNLTMFGFFITSALSMLLVGSLSDSVGRRPVMIAGNALFALSSVACALTHAIEALVVFRMLEAIGFGFVATMTTAMVKDAYIREDLDKAITLTQSLIIIGPAIAPFLGTFFLQFGGWRAIFWFLAACGILGTLLSLTLTETLENANGSKETQRVHSLFASMKSLAFDKRFTALALIMGVAAIPYFAFIAVVSYILLVDFGVSYTEYSIIYAALCCVTIAAPYMYLALSRRMSAPAILKLCFALVALSGLIMLAAGSSSPLAFTLAFAPYALAEGIIRPLAFVVLLDQPENKVGAASAFANCCYNVITSFATVLATLAWTSYVTGIGTLAIASAVVMGALFATCLGKDCKERT